MRSLAITLYTIGAILATYLSWVSFVANLHLGFWFFDSVGSVVGTFVPMWVLMIAVIWAQLSSEQLRWGLAAVVLVSAFTLLLSLVYHAFPDRSDLFGMLHLTAVIGSLIFIFRVYERRAKNENAEGAT